MQSLGVTGNASFFPKYSLLRRRAGDEMEQVLCEEVVMGDINGISYANTKNNYK
jgi:hypothetical protein